MWYIHLYPIEQNILNNQKKEGKVHLSFYIRQKINWSKKFIFARLNFNFSVIFYLDAFAFKPPVSK